MVDYYVEYYINTDNENTQKSTFGYLLVNLYNDNVNCKFIDVGKPTPK